MNIEGEIQIVIFLYIQISRALKAFIIVIISNSSTSSSSNTTSSRQQFITCWIVQIKSCQWPSEVNKLNILKGR